MAVFWSPLPRLPLPAGLAWTFTIPAGMRPDYYLFSESLGRFVVTIAPDNKRAFEHALGSDARLLGRVRRLIPPGNAGNNRARPAVSELEAAYKAPFGRY